jgi:hypothetical protein
MLVANALSWFSHSAAQSFNICCFWGSLNIQLMKIKILNKREQRFRNAALQKKQERAPKRHHRGKGG